MIQDHVSTMGSFSRCTTVLLVICQSFLVWQCSSAIHYQDYDDLQKWPWGSLFPVPFSSHLSSRHRPFKADPSYPPVLKTFTHRHPSPPDLTAAAKVSDPLSEPWSKSGAPPEDGGRPQPEFSKRPLDTVGSGFMKKEKGIKRQLDHVGIGLMKRPLDHLGHGLFKKHSQSQSGDEKEAFAPTADTAEDRFQSERAESKQSAVDLMKKGLDVVGAELLRRGGRHSPGLAELKSALDQLTTALGGTDPGKEVDADMIRQSLDQLGGGLFKRGLDTVGIGLIKRGVDNLDRALPRAASSLTRETEGLALLRKGLDHLGTTLKKDGFDADGVDMITNGALSLATWLIQQRRHAKQHDVVDTLEEKDPEPAQKDYDSVPSGLNKKSFDELGTGLMKKRLDKTESDPKRKFDDNHDTDFDDFDSELLAKTSDTIDDNEFLTKKFEILASLKKKYKEGFIDTKKYVELKSALQNEERDNKITKTFSKNLKPEAKERTYDLYPPMRKQGLDEVGTGVIKKDLDYVGSGLIKKDIDELDWREFEDPETILKEKLGWLKSPEVKSPAGKLNQRSKKQLTDHSSAEILQNKPGEKRHFL